jgi:Holliday junction DNA helicase RuvB
MQSQPRLENLVGQELIRQALRIQIDEAKQREHPLPHILLCGPPEMGKVTFAKAIANEIGYPIRVVSGDSIRKALDSATILTNLRTGELLLVEQIESVRKVGMDILSEVLTDSALDIVIGKGPSARSIKLAFPRLTVIGTTSKLPKLDRHLQHLMSIYEFVPYDVHQIGQIIFSLATQQGIVINSEVADSLAEYSEETPGVASILLKRVYEYARTFALGQITSSVIKDALTAFGYKHHSPTSLRTADRLYREREPIPDDIKMFVWQRDGSHCVKCGSRENLEFDHIIPVSKGGSNTARNLQLLCERCNRSKGGNIV